MEKTLQGEDRGEEAESQTGGHPQSFSSLCKYGSSAGSIRTDLSSSITFQGKDSTELDGLCQGLEDPQKADA